MARDSSTARAAETFVIGSGVRTERLIFLIFLPEVLCPIWGLPRSEFKFIYTVKFFISTSSALQLVETK